MKKEPTTRRDAGADPNDSLIEELQALAARMAKAESDAEAEAGLKKLKQIRTKFLGSESHAVIAARRNAQALIDWMEARLEQLREQLARKRRIQEGEVMEKIAKQREAEGPSLLPTELIDAVVRSTNAKDPEERTSSAPAPEPAKPSAEPERKRKAPKKTNQKTAEEKQNAPSETPEQTAPLQPASPAQKEEPKLQEELTKPDQQKQPEPPEAPEQPAAQERPNPPEQPQPQEQPMLPAQPELGKEPVAQEQPRQPEQPKPQEQPKAEKRPKTEKPEWTKYERLAAHLAESLKDDGKFFHKLRETAKREGPKIAQPADDNVFLAHQRAIYDLGKRLVNLELHTKAIAKAKERQEPVSHLLKTAARELKLFMREFKAAKEARPDMAVDYELRFGGYAEQFTEMKPQKGASILEQCRAERQPAKDAQEKEPEREADAPQLVLKRDDYWQQ